MNNNFGFLKWADFLRNTTIPYFGALEEWGLLLPTATLVAFLQKGVPVIITYATSNQPGILGYNMIYLNLTTTPPSPSVFNVPDVCTRTDNEKQLNFNFNRKRTFEMKLVDELNTLTNARNVESLRAPSVDPNINSLWASQNLVWDFQYNYNDTTALPASHDVGIDSLDDPTTKIQVIKSINVIVNTLLQLAKNNPPKQPWQQQRLVYLQNIQKRWQNALSKSLSDVFIPKHYHAGVVDQFKKNLQDGVVHPTNVTYGFYGAWFSTYPELFFGDVILGLSSAIERLNASKHCRQWQVYPYARYWHGVIQSTPFIDNQHHKITSLGSILVSDDGIKEDVINIIQAQFPNNKPLRDALLSLVMDYNEGLLQRQIILLARIYSADRANALLEWGYASENFASNSSHPLCLANFTTVNQLNHLKSSLIHGEVLWSQDLSYLVITKNNDEYNVTRLNPDPSPYASHAVVTNPLTLDLLANLSQSFTPVRRLGIMLNDTSSPQNFLQQLANGQVTSIVNKIDKSTVVGCGRCCLFLQKRNPSIVLASGSHQMCVNPNVLCPESYSNGWETASNIATVDAQHCSLCDNF